MEGTKYVRKPVEVIGKKLERDSIISTRGGDVSAKKGDYLVAFKGGRKEVYSESGFLDSFDEL